MTEATLNAFDLSRQFGSNYAVEMFHSREQGEV